MSSSENKTYTAKRELKGLLVPFATPVTITKGEHLMIMQAQGDTVTVNFRGQYVRVEADDFEALGYESDYTPPDVPKIEADSDLSAEHIYTVLKDCFDPEIPVNIVDLGLIYGCEVRPLPEGGNQVTVTMTLTAPGCGMGPVLGTDVERMVKKLPTVKEVEVKIVYDPPWDQSMMSPAAKLKLGML